MNKISRKEAQSQGLKRYFTGNPCKHGHVSERRVIGHTCCECASLVSTENSRNFREANQDYHTKYMEDNRDKHNSSVARYRLRHPDRAKESDKRSRLKRKDAIKINKRKWQLDNKDKCAASSAKRRAAKIQRTPAWLTKDDHKTINHLFIKAALFTKYCGRRYNVDHIVPLQGDTVSGLHVPSNLRVISQTENQSKGNKHEI